MRVRMRAVLAECGPVCAAAVFISVCACGLWRYVFPCVRGWALAVCIPVCADGHWRYAFPYARLGIGRLHILMRAPQPKLPGTIFTGALRVRDVNMHFGGELRCTGVVCMGVWVG